MQPPAIDPKTGAAPARALVDAEQARASVATYASELAVEVYDIVRALRTYADEIADAMPPADRRRQMTADEGIDLAAEVRNLLAEMDKRVTKKAAAAEKHAARLVAASDVADVLELWTNG